MSINVTVGNGQGITQAIKSHLEQKGVKLTNVKLSDWQKVMSLVNQNQQMNVNAGKDSIFSGGNDAGKIGKGVGNNWKTDFQVSAGQVMQFDAGIFNKIVEVLTGKAQETPETKETPETPDNKPAIPEDAPKPPALENKLASLASQIETDAPSVPLKTVEQSAADVVDSLDGKIIEREVNGQKQNIAVVTVNGEKVRRAVNEDGTLGDTLVPISTMGKNKYITQTKMDNMMRQALGLPDDAEIPQDIQGSFVSIGGEPTLIFKKDGKTLDQAGLKEYVQNLKQGQTSQQMQEQGAIDISDPQKTAQETFDIINNNFGDKQGNITAEEYINYELQTAPEELKAQFSEEQIRMGAQITFEAMDTTKDGEVTVDELRTFIEASNGNNDESVSDVEMATYVADTRDAELSQGEIDSQEHNQPMVVKGFESPEQQANINQALQEGYTLAPQDGSTVFTKDGKNFTINQDGTIGSEIKADTPNEPTKTSANEETPLKHSGDRSSINNPPNTRETIFGSSLIAANSYDEDGNLKSKSFDMNKFLSSKRGSYIMTSQLIYGTIRESGKFPEQTFKDTNGDVLVSFKDGKWFNEKGKEISREKAYKIMDKAKEANDIGEFVQIPREE